MGRGVGLLRVVAPARRPRLWAAAGLLICCLVSASSAAVAQEEEPGDSGQEAWVDARKALDVAAQVLGLSGGAPDPVEQFSDWATLAGPAAEGSEEPPAVYAGGLLTSQACAGLAAEVEREAASRPDEARRPAGMPSPEDVDVAVRALGGADARQHAVGAACHRVLVAHIGWRAAMKTAEVDPGQVDRSSESPLEEAFGESPLTSLPGVEAMSGSAVMAMSLWAASGYHTTSDPDDGVAVLLFEHSPDPDRPYCSEHGWGADYHGKVVVSAPCPDRPDMGVCPSGLTFVAGLSEHAPGSPAPSGSPRPPTEREAEPEEGPPSSVPWCQSMQTAEEKAGEDEGRNSELMERAEEIAQALTAGGELVSWGHDIDHIWSEAWWIRLPDGGWGCAASGRQAGRDGASACALLRPQECEPPAAYDLAGAKMAMTLCAAESMRVIALSRSAETPPDETSNTPPGPGASPAGESLALRDQIFGPPPGGNALDELKHLPAVDEEGVTWAWHPPRPPAPRFGDLLAAFVAPGGNLVVHEPQAAAAFAAAFQLGWMSEEATPGMSDSQRDAALAALEDDNTAGCRLALHAAFSDGAQHCNPPPLEILREWGWTEEFSAVVGADCAASVQAAERLPISSADSAALSRVEDSQIVLRDHADQEFRVHACLGPAVESIFKRAGNSGIVLTVSSAYRRWFLLENPGENPRR